VNVVRDPALIDRLWKEAWKVWFPRGKSDPSIALLRFDAERGEFWDNSGLQGLSYVFEAAKAYVRGERPHVDPDQHGQVRLR
jgi:general stress protein 26